MQKYLSNLANYLMIQHAINHPLNPDVSGTFLHKLPRKQIYQLIKEQTNKPVIEIQFFTNKAPQYYIYNN